MLSLFCYNEINQVDTLASVGRVGFCRDNRLKHGTETPSLFYCLTMIVERGGAESFDFFIGLLQKKLKLFM